MKIQLHQLHLSIPLLLRVSFLKTSILLQLVRDLSPVSVPLYLNLAKLTDAERAATNAATRLVAKRLATAARARKYRASLTEEQKTERRRKDAQRHQMNYTLQRIQKRVASTDFTDEHIPEVNTHNILKTFSLLLKLTIQ